MNRPPSLLPPLANSSLSAIEDKTPLDFQLILSVYISFDSPALFTNVPLSADIQNGFSGPSFLTLHTYLIKRFQTTLNESCLSPRLLAIMRFTPYAYAWLVVFAPLPLMRAIPVNTEASSPGRLEGRLEVDGEIYPTSTVKEMIEIMLPERLLGHSDAEVPVKSFVIEKMNIAHDDPLQAFIRITKDNGALSIVPAAKVPEGAVSFRVRYMLMARNDILHKTDVGGWVEPEPRSDHKYNGKLEKVENIVRKPDWGNFGICKDPWDPSKRLEGFQARLTYGPSRLVRPGDVR
ncbi:hypothetical protein EV361DRAFT_872030 [Lentinula raphanica]|nr:hypothetical protein EV361DRAFT_872030 [Lentinula raphanica]